MRARKVSRAQRLTVLRTTQPSAQATAQEYYTAQHNVIVVNDLS